MNWAIKAGDKDEGDKDSGVDPDDAEIGKTDVLTHGLSANVTFWNSIEVDLSLDQWMSMVVSVTWVLGRPYSQSKKRNSRHKNIISCHQVY